MIWQALVVALAMVTGNFLWQLVSERRWGKAVERTFFQAIALATFVFVT